MPKDESMDVRIAILESKVDDLLGKFEEFKRDYATKAEFADLQRQIEGIRADVERLDRRVQRLEERIAHLEERMTRLEQRIESEFKQVATKAESRKDLLTFALGIITIQTAINAAMITAVVQFLR
ncbi:hypothetical protein GM658_22330 [Pseudoduganella eburnea]|uniref:DUF1640 domain-containing protein n=1 Tax=Massilia eburnea TaxID=1776165 RepID=A0A6L6QMM4_9BURK|nr:hypothetical protein [Massilia eburnea]MTW13351.1 hypothetical protein [Massilia eburnea]